MSEKNSVECGDRPAWCPHPECKLLRYMQNKVCIGDLLKKISHDNGFEGLNTHRLCFRGFGGSGWKGIVFDFMVNTGDLYAFKTAFDAVKKHPDIEKVEEWEPIHIKNIKKKSEIIHKIAKALSSGKTMNQAISKAISEINKIKAEEKSEPVDANGKNIKIKIKKILSGTLLSLFATAILYDLFCIYIRCLGSAYQWMGITTLITYTIMVVSVFIVLMFIGIKK